MTEQTIRVLAAEARATEARLAALERRYSQLGIVQYLRDRLAILNDHTARVRECCASIADEVREEARNYGHGQMALGAAEVRDRIRGRP